MPTQERLSIEETSCTHDDWSKRFGHCIIPINENRFFIHGGACFDEKNDKLTIFAQTFDVSVSISENEAPHFIVTKVKDSSNRPQPRYSHHALKWNSDIFVFGGSSGYSTPKQCITDMHCLNIESFRWNAVHTDGKQPVGLGSTANLVSNLIFVFGGIAYGQALNALTVYDIANGRWRDVPTTGTPPSPRCDHGAAVVKSHIYYFGGTGDKQTFFNDLHRFDTGTLSWESIVFNNLNLAPRAGVTLLSDNKKLFLFGGYNDHIYPDGGPVAEDLLAYNIRRRRWEYMETLVESDRLSCRARLSRFHTSAFLHNNRLICVGGITLEGECGEFISFQINSDKTTSHAAVLNQHPIAVSPSFEDSESRM